MKNIKFKVEVHLPTKDTDTVVQYSREIEASDHFTAKRQGIAAAEKALTNLGYVTTGSKPKFVKVLEIEQDFSREKTAPSTNYPVPVIPDKDVEDMFRNKMFKKVEIKKKQVLTIKDKNLC